MEVESLVESLQQKFISPRTRFGQERIASCEDIFLKKDKNNPAYKIIMMGSLSSGKSSLVSRWTRGEFKERTESTIGIQLASKALKINDRMVVCQLWDAAGCEHFQAVTKTFYRDAMGVLFVFDITNKDSFKDLVNWYDEAAKHLDLEYTSLAVAANKIDLENPAVSIAEIEEFTKSRNIMLFYTSAAKDDQVDEAFKTLFDDVAKKQQARTKRRWEVLLTLLAGVHKNKLEDGCPLAVFQKCKSKIALRNVLQQLMDNFV